MNAPKVIGIDPSLDATGICWANSETETVHRSSGDHRLADIYDAVTSACYIDPELAVIEDLPVHAMSAGKTGMAQGVVRYALIHSDTPYVTVTPSTLKRFAAGKGNATKSDMRMELYKRTGIDLADDNQVDAWWLRQLGLHLLVADDRLALPQSHTVALDKVRLPAGLVTA